MCLLVLVDERYHEAQAAFWKLNQHAFIFHMRANCGTPAHGCLRVPRPQFLRFDRNFGHVHQATAEQDVAKSE